MAINEFSKALARVLVYEGGKVDDPRDPGGRTNKGVTQLTYNTYRVRNGKSKQDVFKISDTEVAAIYKEMYWDRIKGDVLPVGVAFCVFDAAVNSGVGQAAKWLQRALGESYTGIVSGDMGPTTLQAVAEDPDNDQLISRFCARRLGSLKQLRTYKTYGKGWSARIANVLKIAQSWATGSIGPAPVDVTPLGGHNKAKITETVQPLVSANVAHATTGSGAVGTTITQMTDAVTPYKDSHVYVTYAFIGLTAAGILAGAYATWKVSEAQKARDGAKAVYVDENADADLLPVAIVGEDNSPPAPNPPTPEPSPPAPMRTPPLTGLNATDNAKQDRIANTREPG